MRQPICIVEGSARTVYLFIKYTGNGWRIIILLSPFAKDEAEG